MSKIGIIAFVGTVGAGKSTQMKILLSALNARGLKVKVTYLKTGHMLAYFFEAVMAKLLVSDKQDVYPLRVLVEYKTVLFKKLFKLWLYLDVISISIRFIWTVYIPLKLQDVVIVEEYLHATITDYFYLAKVLNLPLKTIYPAVRFMQKLLILSGCVHTIFLDAPTKTLTSRWNKRSSLTEKPDYVQMQRTWLLSISKFSSSFIYIETGNRSIDKTGDQIINHLKNMKLLDCSIKPNLS